MKGLKNILIIIIFLSGFILGATISQFDKQEVNMPSGQKIEQLVVQQKNNTEEPNKDWKVGEPPQKRDSPQDRIQEKDIRSYNMRILIEVENAIIARFTDTRSMEPILTKDANAIEIIPKDINDVKVGDIISYESKFSQGTIIHRVIDKDIDEQGLYFRTKGDNLNYDDPEKIRFNQIKRVLVGILY
jgi:hypothetical protein